MRMLLFEHGIFWWGSEAAPHPGLLRWLTSFRVANALNCVVESALRVDSTTQNLAALAGMGMRAIALSLAMVLLSWVMLPMNAHAVASNAELMPLTLDILKDRVQLPVQREGIPTIDLRRFVIDLRTDAETSIREPFYRLIQNKMRTANPPIGLDLSYSVVKGDVNLSELGVQVPLYSQTFPSVFDDAEQAQLERDRRRLLQLSQLSKSLLLQSPAASLQISLFPGALKAIQTTFENSLSFANTYIQGTVDASGAIFRQSLIMPESRFSQRANFAGIFVGQNLQCSNVLFFDRAIFAQGRFSGLVSFEDTEFRGVANFSQATFQESVNLSNAVWKDSADLGKTEWRSSVRFNKSKFFQALFLNNADFEEAVTFRETQFSQPVNLRSAKIRSQADFGDAAFSPGSYLNVSGLEFNADEAKILGNPGTIGRMISVPTLQGNETLLRNLVRNFRLLEQIADANQVEYRAERLRLKQLWKNLTRPNLNTTSITELQTLGLTQEQAEAIAQSREEQLFQRVSDLLKLDAIDLTTYVNINKDVVAIPPRTASSWVFDALYWLGLNGLIVLTSYGTSVGLILSTGLLLTAYFSLLFWLVDRFRKLRPSPIVPTALETILLSLSTGFISVVCSVAIFRISDYPWLTLACLALFSIPIPSVLIGRIYQQGRYHDLMDSSYFWEDGSARQLRLLIGRLPIIPKFAFFRDRFTPILWDRRWSWLNYLDFSLINLFKLGFNDIRLRDEQMPGLISALVWYQWALGLLYVALLLWTLSRTIPGLNLLLYF